MLWCLAGHGQTDKKTGALTRLTFSPDISVQQFHQLPGKGKSQARSLYGLFIALVKPVKTLEDMGQCLFRYTRSIVADPDLKAFTGIGFLNISEHWKAGWTGPALFFPHHSPLKKNQLPD